MEIQSALNSGLEGFKKATEDEKFKLRFVNSPIETIQEMVGFSLSIITKIQS